MDAGEFNFPCCRYLSSARRKLRAHRTPHQPIVPRSIDSLLN